MLHSRNSNSEPVRKSSKLCAAPSLLGLAGILLCVPFSRTRQSGPPRFSGFLGRLIARIKFTFLKALTILLFLQLLNNEIDASGQEDFRSKSLDSLSLNFAFVRRVNGRSAIEFFDAREFKDRHTTPFVTLVDKDSMQLTVQANSNLLQSGIASQAQANRLFKLISKTNRVDVLVLAPGILDEKWVALYQEAAGKISLYKSATGMKDPGFDQHKDPSAQLALQIMQKNGYNAAVLRTAEGKIEVYSPSATDLTGRQAIVFATTDLTRPTTNDSPAGAILRLTQRAEQGRYFAELVLSDSKTWQRISLAKAHIE